MPTNELTFQQQQYDKLAKAQDGMKAFARLFELAGHSADQARDLAEKEAYHLSQMMCDSEDLRTIATKNPAVLLMEMRKIPLLGVSLDPTLKLAFLIVQDKAAGKVQLEVTGRGKVVQAIAQGLVRSVDITIVFEGDEVKSNPAGQLYVVPNFGKQDTAKVTGGWITITWPDGRITQDIYKQSHIENWRKRSEARFRGNANANYQSFNGGIEPGFLGAKMLKHKLDKIGINPFPVKRERLEEIVKLAPITNEAVVVYSEPGPFKATEEELNIDTKF